jgi:predicted MFS family arabinose efflux permease
MVKFVNLMLSSSINLFRNAYSGLSRSIWWLSFIMFINRCGTMVIPFLTVYLTVKLHFSIAEAGMIMGIFGFGAVIGAWVGGRLSDNFGFYRVQFWSLLLNGVMFMILGYMKTFQQFGVCIFLMSIVGEAFRPANAAAIASYSKIENHTRSYSLNRLAVNLGFSIGPAIGGLLAAYNYQLLFWADGITCVLAAFILLAVLPPMKPNTTDKKINREKAKADPAYKDYVFLKFIFLVFMMAVCFLMLFSMVPIYYKEIIKLNESAIGLLLAMNGLIIVLIEMVVVYKIEGKRSSTFFISIGAFLIGLSFLMFNIQQSFMLVVFAMIVISFGEILMFPFINSFWVQRSKDHNRGQYAALFTMSFSTALILAPTLGSQIINHFGFPTLWYLNFVLCSLSAVGFIYLLKEKNK